MNTWLTRDFHLYIFSSSHGLFLFCLRCTNLDKTSENKVNRNGDGAKGIRRVIDMDAPAPCSVCARNRRHPELNAFERSWFSYKRSWWSLIRADASLPAATTWALILLTSHWSDARTGSEHTPNTPVELDKCKKIDADKRTEAKKLTRDLGIWGVRSPCSGP